MKNFILILIVSLFAISCNSGQKENHEQIVSDSIAPTDHEADMHSHDMSETGIALNNGAKWKSDESTTKNVNALAKVTEEFKASGKTELVDYKKVAADLQSQIDNLIKECRMKGPDHDALHGWLEPLMKMVKDLKDSPDAKAAQEKFNEIDQQIARFTNSFE